MQTILQKQNGDFFIPAAVNTAFAVELLLKFFIVAANPDLTYAELKARGLHARGHKYSELWDRLHPKFRGAILAEYSMLSQAGSVLPDIPAVLTELGDAPFVDWRYPFEDLTYRELDSGELQQVADAMQSVGRGACETGQRRATACCDHGVHPGDLPQRSPLQLMPVSPRSDRGGLGSTEYLLDQAHGVGKQPQLHEAPASKGANVRSWPIADTHWIEGSATLNEESDHSLCRGASRMSFKIIFITEGEVANPAVEIQFKGKGSVLFISRLLAPLRSTSSMTYMSGETQR